MHFWLSSENVKSFATALSKKLILSFPKHQNKIQSNLNALILEITVLDDAFKEKVQSKDQPAFMVFHDGFHYLSDQYQLNEVAAIVSDPSQSTGIKTLLELKALIIDSSVKCIFVEPGFNQGLVDTLIESVLEESNNKVKVLTWDVLGNNSQNYPELLGGIYDEYALCD